MPDTIIWVDPDKVEVPSFHRALKPWVLARLRKSMTDHGYNVAYPITICNGLTLVDGRHRLVVAQELKLKKKLSKIPAIKKPDDVGMVRFGLQCNADGQLGSPDDVFDLAELVSNLSNEGWTGLKIAQELKWSETNVTFHKQIKDQLHPKVWSLARFTKSPAFEKPTDENLVNPEFTIVNWRESHFRSLLKWLTWAKGNNAVFRAQMDIVGEAQGRWLRDSKVTASWIDEVATSYAWRIELKRYAISNLVKEVGIRDRVSLFKSINNNVFGKKKSDKDYASFVKAVSTLNEKALGVRLYCEDALRIIPQLKDGSISLVIADPPYNVTDNLWDKFSSPEEYLAWLEEFINSLKPKMAEEYHLFLFCAPLYMSRIEILLLNEGLPLKSRIVWSYRNMSMGRDVTDKFISSWQPVFHCGNHSLNWSPEWNDERLDVQVYASPQSNYEDEKLHPTAKPLELIRLFVRVGSKPGEIVVDPFAGGGVTGEACSKEGQRRCILIEKEEKYAQVIEKRLGIKREDTVGD